MAIPGWFNVISSVYNIISFLVAGAISFLGYKAYKLLKDKKYLNFSISFLFITLSFIVFMLTNLLVYINLGAGAVKILNIINWGFISYALLTVAGFFLLVLLTFKIRNIKFISLLSLAIIAALIFSDFIMTFIQMFHIILFALTLALSFHYYKNCTEKKTTNSKLVFSAFSLIMISHIFSFASGANEVIFAIGNTVLVLGYILLLATILRLK